MLNDITLAVELKKLQSQAFVVFGVLENIDQPALTTAIRDKAIEIGLREVKNWNLSDVLAKAEHGHLVVKLGRAWKLLPDGKMKLRDAGFPLRGQIVEQARHNLLSQVSKIADEARKSFLIEAVSAFDNGCHRAAVVFSWVGASAVIQENVVNKHLSSFNASGLARFGPNFKPARTTKELAELTESGLIQLCQDCGMLDKSEKQELQARLDLRNRCGHPNAFTLADHVVASHIESLTMNVYQRY
ncbi:MAG: hypothetical protein WCD20_20470 [Rhodomicrobium sp.]